MLNLPYELNILIVQGLSRKDWLSLRLVNSVWKSIITAAATIHLNSIQQQLSELSAINYNSLSQKLIREVESFRMQNRVGESEAEKKLKLICKGVEYLREPLAKFLFFTEQLEVLDHALIQKRNSLNPFIFKTGLMSRQGKVNEIIAPALKICNDFSQSSWFQKMLICIKLNPKHHVAQTFAQAILKVEEQKAIIDAEEEDSLRPRINRLLPLPARSDEQCHIPLTVSLPSLHNILAISPPRIPAPELKSYESIKRQP
ncbi:hypothetical protein OQJ18_05200 [Fluoribacter dumoffii]|uniref:F-box protein n=1 Tax=Fluoribacter dumoffii TaxID=463 RepID=UPI00026C8153|nr:F-box protein [Fluoribacter dumoffii]MCW8385466.1 hypothetical protein [Fluoribacter dumoffii]MCW8418517.1 hypothetical protein [Fluoribacter dumoffii]MCW8453641.1 hypothetical protein [Fluoribacter dumoffii]MCW8459141.1 hypothetical protein [Fluoribacter dumoffii]MCW8482500.1 hypothetical protein [Fluoribacter dumoffii]